MIRVDYSHHNSYYAPRSTLRYENGPAIFTVVELFINRGVFNTYITLTGKKPGQGARKSLVRHSITNRHRRFAADTFQTMPWGRSVWHERG